MRVWFGMVGSVNWTGLVTTSEMKLRTLDDVLVTDVRRIYACACETGYPVVQDLLRFSLL